MGVLELWCLYVIRWFSVVVCDIVCCIFLKKGCGGV